MSKVGFHRVDTWLIYEVDEDPGMWVAHSLNTDQIAMGQSVLDAYVELRKVMTILAEEYQKNPKLDIWTPAGPEVIARLEHARMLPKEIMEIAEIKLAGKRPRQKYQEPWGGRCKTLTVAVEV